MLRAIAKKLRLSVLTNAEFKLIYDYADEWAASQLRAARNRGFAIFYRQKAIDIRDWLIEMCAGLQEALDGSPNRANEAWRGLPNDLRARLERAEWEASK